MSDIPTAFGKFQVLARISAGSTAEVYRSRVDGINGFHRTYAIKRILPHLTRNPDFVEVLIEEAKIAGLLSHTNIVQIMDLGQVDDTYYIAMEFVDGPDLGKAMQRCRSKGISIPVPHAVFSTLEILKGLEYAHGRQVLRGGQLEPLNIVHRDVSPSNILMSFRGEIKISDFGIAKASIRALETLPGLIKNRLHYASPEQVLGEPIDQRADLFSTGIVLYEMLTSHHPFTQKTETATVQALQQGNFRRPSEVNTAIPKELDDIIFTALAVRPQHRFSSATDMKEALDQFFHRSGFIFSNASMASFLDGLFPNREIAPSSAVESMIALSNSNASERFTRPIRSHEEPPTEVMKRHATDELELPEAEVPVERTIRHRPPPSFLDEFQDISRSSALGPIAVAGDESTLVRERPKTDDPSTWSNEETIIKSRKPRKALSAPVKPTPSPAPPPAPSAPTERRTRTTTQASQPKPKPPPKRLQLVYTVVGAVVTGMVLWVGILLGIRLSERTSPPPDGELEMTLPDGATLEVNDKEHDPEDSLKLRSGDQEMVRITLPDYTSDPVTLELELDSLELEIRLEPTVTEEDDPINGDPDTDKD